jgi:hypothetical protein
MALPMTRPTKHPKTGIYRLRKSVPRCAQVRLWQTGMGRRLGDEGLEGGEGARPCGP